MGRMARTCVMMVITLAVAVVLVAAPARAQVAKPTPEDLKLGEQVFFKRCVWCHGPQGNGEGPSFERAFPKPRNFNPGTFKIRTTDSGELPVDADLMRTVRKGLAGSLMPPWEQILSDREIFAVVQFVKTKMVQDRKFDDPEEKFKRIPGSKDGEVITPDPLRLSFPEKVSPSKDSIARGAENFFRAGCFGCHGAQGRGEGNPSLKDEFPIPGFPEGAPIRAADLHQCWRLRGASDPDTGAIPEEIIREISTGLNGTPMPSSANELKKLSERWDLANFVIFLCGKTESMDELFEPAKDLPSQLAGKSVTEILAKATEIPDLQKQLGQGKFVALKADFAKSRMLVGHRPPLEAIVTGRFVQELPTTVDDPKWKEAPKDHVRMGGQVSIEPRQFMPTIPTLTVQALYDKKEIAFLLQWDDRDRSSVAGETDFISGKSDTPKQAAFLNPASNPAKVITNDAVEIQFPAKMHELTGTEKPFWINGDERHAVILWHWEADLAKALAAKDSLPEKAKKTWAMWTKLQQEPAVIEQIAKGSQGDVVELYANGFKKEPFDPKRSVEEQSAQPTHRPRPANEQGAKSTDARWAGGQWRVVIRGPMSAQAKLDKPSEGYTNIGAGLYLPIAFSVFDGSNGEQDTKRSISTWYAILPAPPLPKAIYYVPPTAAAVVLVFEWWLRRTSKRMMNGSGQGPGPSKH